MRQVDDPDLTTEQDTIRLVQPIKISMNQPFMITDFQTLLIQCDEIWR